MTRHRCHTSRAAWSLLAPAAVCSLSCITACAGRDEKRDGHRIDGTWQVEPIATDVLSAPDYVIDVGADGRLHAAFVNSAGALQYATECR